VYVKERASLTRSLKATRTRTQTACLYKRDTTAPRGAAALLAPGGPRERGGREKREREEDKRE